MGETRAHSRIMKGVAPRTRPGSAGHPCRPSRRHRDRPIASILVIAILLLVTATTALLLDGSSQVSGEPAALLSRTTRSPGHGSSTSRSPGISLVSQTSWVVPGHGFDISVSAPRPSAPANLGFRVTVYGMLTSRSAFHQAMNGNLTTQALDSSPLIPVSSDTTAGHRIASLHMPVQAMGAVGGGRGPWTVRLFCSPGTCDGVYPVSVSLVARATGRTIGSLVTALVYYTGGATQPLRVASVVPLSLTATASRPGTHTGASHSISSTDLGLGPRLGLSGITHLAQVVSVLGHYPSVDNSLILDGQTAEYLAMSSAATERPILGELVALTSNSAAHQLVDPTYTEIDATEISMSGIENTLGLQLSLGRQMLSKAGFHLPAMRTWLSDRRLSIQAMQALQSYGVQTFAVPPDNFQSVSTLLTPTSPVHYPLPAPTGSASSTGTGTQAPARDGLAVTIDPGLSVRFSTTRDPVLAAHQMLADLAEIYFGTPNDPLARGVVAAGLSPSAPSPAFLATFLAGLENSPMLRSTTLSDLLSSVTPNSGANGDRILNPPPNSLDSAIISTLGKDGGDIASVASSIPASSPTVLELQSTLLDMESSLLKPGEQSDLENAFTAELHTWTSSITFPPARSVILTSRSARVPITIVSQGRLPVKAVITLESTTLEFPHGDRQLVTLSRRNSTVYFAVTARAPGDFPLLATLRAPHGNLTISRERLTVHSTAVSSVAIVLSILSLLLLAGWWLRSLHRSYREKHRRDKMPRAA